MNTKILYRNVVLVILGLVLIWGINFYWKNLRGVGPAINEPKQDIAELIPKPGENKTGMPLKLPDGFSIEIFAENLSGARVLAFDGTGDLWVSRTQQGIVTEVQKDRDGNLVSQKDIYASLSKPHGLTFQINGDDNVIYIAEENKISRGSIFWDNSKLTKIADLPTEGGGHFTRTIGFEPRDRDIFNPDLRPDKLFVSIGSSCNVCNESDSRRAAIYSMNSDGSDFKLFAKGLRNTVFFTWDKDGRMWGTDMGRDLLGDDIPPEEINIIEEGRDYGWPTCYGKNTPDPFGKECGGKAPAHVEMQAHSAPLGLAFVPKGFGPNDWENDLIVAFHGSWNRSTPTGYKLVRIKFDDEGNYQGIEDFITGWLQGGTALGRPVDAVFHDGDLYVSDDKAGVIYKISSKF
ncbi:MAG: PQQ-dependent sugar dehydrogenase [Candidatus Doudnabacteria bacterium]|nr:PQQ-dependent sugar dehydrogenase [Candidatus Doudnabacteria bacterium]